jgi:hypothetical protein
VRALHHCVVGQVPLLPWMTSCRLVDDPFAYGVALLEPLPASAYTAAMIGDDSLVPPHCDQLELLLLVGE